MTESWYLIQYEKLNNHAYYVTLIRIYVLNLVQCDIHNIVQLEQVFRLNKLCSNFILLYETKCDLYSHTKLLTSRKIHLTLSKMLQVTS